VRVIAQVIELWFEIRFSDTAFPLRVCTAEPVERFVSLVSSGVNLCDWKRLARAALNHRLLQRRVGVLFPAQRVVRDGVEIGTLFVFDTASLAIEALELEVREVPLLPV
jgi:hypothetical protein